MTEDPRAWWEWILLGAIAAGTVVALIGGYQRYGVGRKKQRGPGARS